MRLTITGASDPRLADYVGLRDASLRRHLESDHGLFIAEGAKVIRRAIHAGYQPRSFLLAQRWEQVATMAEPFAHPLRSGTSFWMRRRASSASLP